MKLSEVIYFGIIYNLIFLGYYVSNGFLTILYPNEAFIAFAVFYGTYCIFSLVSPWILNKLNLKICLIISSFTFVLYVGAVASKISFLMLVGAGICGAGNALIWLSQGHWMSFFSGVKSTTGEFANVKTMKIGIFFGIFYANILLGNIIAVITIYAGSTDIMLYTMIGINCIGFVLTFFIPLYSPSNSSFSIKEVFTVIKINKGYLLIELFLVQAIALNVTYQIIPLSIINIKSNQDLNIFTACVFIAYGFSSMVSALVLGKLYDKIGKFSIVVSYLTLELFSLSGILLINLYSNELGYWIIIGFVRGISDNIINTIINITIVINYSEAKDMFALYRFIYALSYVVFAILVPYIPYQYYLMITGIVTILSFSIFLFYKDAPILNSLEQQFNNSGIPIS